ncbi:TetR/AcrR family transcriptional regulator [Paenibacillus koleovorans]|uniref:TetR/AcrR family transcriptional regulator n=1 Tax=Paenibacillus koleovorans TaxID=121608 RepID=UPI000FD79767|nr:TetR/AcrR family transcriptional regulator [Paenibacillus koleovorans]
MSEKKRQIIEAAMKCFAEKGYRGTSIQDIADTMGIGKGSLYFYFRSKEDLLVSICKHHFETMFLEFRALMQDPQIAPRDKLIRQVVLNYAYFVQHGDFFKMLLEERFEVNEELHQFLFSMKTYSLIENRKCIAAMYGQEAEPHTFDAATMFTSMVSGYMGYLVHEQVQLDFERTAAYIVDRLDDLVQALIGRREEPLLPPETIGRLFAQSPFGFKPPTGLAEELEAIRGMADSLQLSPAKRAELDSALQMLEAEFEKPEPQLVLVKGMLALLRGLKAAKLKKPIANIERYFQL